MRTRLQLLHMLAGVLIAGLLGIPIVTLHLTSDPTSWGSMIGRATQGIWVGIYIALLAAVLYHALYGLRGIILETTTSPKIERIITRTLIVIGVVAFIWGSYVPVALLSG
ncbi:hypothetical protein ACFLXU_03660 [Chloroflexota bacterium]